MRKYIIWSASCIAIMLFTIVISIWQINRNPVITIPPQPALPSPNAFDYFTQAGDALQGVDNINIRSATLAEKRRLVLKNATAHAIFREGLSYQYGESYERSWDTKFPHFRQYRDLVKLLEVESQLSAASGDWQDATNCSIEIVAFGTKVPHAGLLLGMQMGSALNSIGFSSLRETIRHCDARTAANTARRLEEITTERIPLAVVLREDANGTRVALLNTLRKPNWRSAIDCLVNEQFSVSPSKPPMGKLTRTILSQCEFMNASGAPQIPIPIFASKREIMQQCVRYQDDFITEAKKPYPLRKEIPLPRLGVCYYLMSVYAPACFRYGTVETHHQILMTQFALRAYFLDHHTYPASLKDLTPNYLNSIPSDPFAVKGSLQYKRNKTGYILYSIGPDGIDSGGLPSIDGQNPDKQQKALPGEAWTTATSIGDIVAGVNVR